MLMALATQTVAEMAIAKRTVVITIAARRQRIGIVLPPEFGFYFE